MTRDNGDPAVRFLTSALDVRNTDHKSFVDIPRKI